MTSLRKGRRSSLTAAGRRYAVQLPGTRTVNPDSGWQAEAWQWYRTTPEVRQTAAWISNALAGATLYAGKLGPDNSIVAAPEDHLAAQLVSQIAGGPLGQSNFLAQWGSHLTVAGEGWIVIKPKINKAEEVAGYEWFVLSTAEVTSENGVILAEIAGVPTPIPQYDPEHPDPRAPVAIRVWRPAPWRHIEADSPVRSAFVILEELNLLTAAVAAIARSRLTGRGLLLVPKGVRFPRPGTVQGDSEDDVIDVLLEVASTAIQEPESAAATVPIVLEVPADAVDKIKWLSFQSDFDDIAIRLREECIKRYASGQDMPAELILGLGDTNHWSANLLTSEGVKLAVDPAAKLVTEALTSQWLQLLLEGAGVEDADEWFVVADTSEVKAAASRPATALEAFKIGLISAPAARRELGYTEGDRPGAEAEVEAETDEVESAPLAPVTELPQAETGDAPDEAPPLLAESA
jgi:hypothetical protein